jgi:hypothetical protein
MSALDLADIQGGILRAYGRQGFPKARYFFLTIRKPEAGRHFVETLRPRITTAARWKNPGREEPLLRTRNPRVKDVVRAEGAPDYPGEVQLIKPKVALNIAFTFPGLQALEVAACDRRIPARLSRRGARDRRRRDAVGFQPQWHFYGLPQAASERRCVPEFHDRDGRAVRRRCRHR